MRLPVIAEIYAAAGFDFIMIDNEHTAISISETVEIMRVARLCNIAPFVRIPEIEYSSINRMLDHGAQGIIAPRVTKRDQVIDLIDIMRYPPDGSRGFGPSGSCTGYCNLLDIDGKEFVGRTNSSIMLVVMIESESAVNDIDDIISVPGVDIVLVGPNDLSLTLGCPCQIYDERMVSLIYEVIEKSKKHGIASGCAGYDVDGFLKWINAGMQFFWVASEVGMILSQGRQIVKNLRGSDI